MTPKYEYIFIRGWWVIFCDGERTEEMYRSHEYAKKRVYQLNGWTYKPKKKIC